MTQQRQRPERSTRQGSGAGRVCAVSGCRIEATHAVFEAAANPDSGETILRPDARLPQVCTAHAGQDGMAGRLTQLGGAVAGTRGSAFIVPRLP
jgi:hypothetical protein